MQNVTIQGMIRQVEGKQISFTGIQGGEIINGRELNFPIAEALMTLPNVENFGAGEIYLPDDLLDESGVVLTHGEAIVFIDYNGWTKQVDRIIINDRDSETLVLQALMLLEAKKNTSGVDIGERLASVANQQMIQPESEESVALHQLVCEFEDLLRVGKLHPAIDIIVDEDIELITVIDEKASLGLVAKDEVSLAPVIASVDESVDELEDDDTSSVEEAEDISSEEMFEAAKKDVLAIPGKLLSVKEMAQLIQERRERGATLEVIAEEAGVSISTVSKTMNLGNVAKKSLIKLQQALVGDVPEASMIDVLKTPPVAATERVVEVVKEVVKEVPKETPKQPAPTVEEVKASRPLIWDDDAVREYLRPFPFELKPFHSKEAFIDAVIAFRKEQREQHVPTEAMMNIQPALTYVGDVLPLEIGIKNMWQDIHTIYKGPAGTGKTVIAQTLSALLNMPLYTMNGSTDTDADMIIGSQGAENGSTYVMKGLLINAMENAGIFYADEANFVLPEILSVVNAALDHRKEIYNYNLHEHVKGHPHFRFIASINEGYEGTRNMNKATTDRTVSVVVDYMSPAHLKNYLKNYMKSQDLTDFQRNVLKMDEVGDADIILLANIAKALQEGVKNPEIGLPQEVASTRNIVQLLRATRTLPFEVAVKTIVQKYDPDIRESIVGVLENVQRLNIVAEDIISA